MYEFMLAMKIGDQIETVYTTIAKYYELSIMDYRKADEVFRQGLKSLEDRELEKLEF